MSYFYGKVTKRHPNAEILRVWKVCKSYFFLLILNINYSFQVKLNCSKICGG